MQEGLLSGVSVPFGEGESLETGEERNGGLARTFEAGVLLRQVIKDCRDIQPKHIDSGWVPTLGASNSGRP